MNNIDKETRDKTLFAMNYSAVMLDVFEDFLEEKGITIENDEKDEDSSDAILYGTDYDNIEQKLLPILVDFFKEAKTKTEINTESYGS